jgi:tetratricopeptide (TPR) repeat protein
VSITNTKLCAEAKKAFDKGIRKSGKTLFRWKPNWEKAAFYFREAIKKYKKTQDINMLIQAYIKSALAHEQVGSYHTSGSDMENAADLYRKQDLANDAALGYIQSSKYYKMNNSLMKSANMLMRAAECINDPFLGIAYMRDACDTFNTTEMWIYSDTTFKKSISYAIKNNLFVDAIDLLQTQNIIIEQMISQQNQQVFESVLYKNMLSIIILYLYKNEYQKARAEFSTFENSGKFNASTEFIVGSNLLDAYTDSDQSELDAVIKQNTVKLLPNSIVQIAYKLKINNVINPSSADKSVVDIEESHSSRPEDDFR